MTRRFKVANVNRFPDYEQIRLQEEIENPEENPEKRRQDINLRIDKDDADFGSTDPGEFFVLSKE